MKTSFVFFINFSLFYFKIVVLTRSESQCEYANIHVTHEDGKEQVFRVKQLPPPTMQSVHPTDDSPLTNHGDFIPAISFEVGELVSICETKEDVPFGLCAFRSSCLESCFLEDKKTVNKPQVRKYADAIVKRGFVPMATGKPEIDREIAYGVVLLNIGLTDEAIRHFTEFLQKNPKSTAGYVLRGAAFGRKGLQFEENALRAHSDLTKGITIDPTLAESFERRAEALLSLRQYDATLYDINRAIQLRSSPKLYYLRGVVHFITQNLIEAEKDLKHSLVLEENYLVLYQLGLTLYYRGRARNAIEVFRNIVKVKGDFVDGYVALGHAYRELGLVRQAKEHFSKSLTLSPKSSLVHQLRGSLAYHSGELAAAMEDLNECLLIKPSSLMCQYLHGVTNIAQGQFYEGIKSVTKLMVSQNRPNSPIHIRASAEFIKAHYLREYARYLHTKLDKSISSLDLDGELNGELRDQWIKTMPFEFEDPYLEQPGLRPEISDVPTYPFSHYDKNVQQLICDATATGWLGQVRSDGFLPNRRLNLAMGLATIHVAQTMEGFWKNTRKDQNFTWQDLFQIPVYYRRLVDPEQPVLTLDAIPEKYFVDGYKFDLHFMRGHVINTKMMQYFDLVYKLVKTMIEHYSGDGIKNYPMFKQDMQDATTCEDLLNIAKKRNINQQAVMSTQVPSLKDPSNPDLRHDGVILTLSGNGEDGNVFFSINVATTRERSASYHTELDFLFKKLVDEVGKAGVSNKILDVDNILNTILSMVYYYYNLMPLSRGSSVVAYTVALGLIMSLGKEVTGKIPQGKLVNMEAMLSGGPDAFVMVVKQWLNIKKLNTPLSSMAEVEKVFPTVRSILEVLNLNYAVC